MPKQDMYNVTLYVTRDKAKESPKNPVVFDRKRRFIYIYNIYIFLLILQLHIVLQTIGS